MLKRSFDIFIGLTFLGLFGQYIYKHYTGLNQEKKSRLESVKTSDILKRKTEIPENILNRTLTSSVCTLFLKNTAEISINDYVHEFANHKVDEIIKTCNGALPNYLQQNINKALIECKNSNYDKVTKECYLALVNAKITSVASIIKPDLNPRELDATILLHLIADKFITGNLMEYPEKNLELIDALIAKEPNYLSVFKIKLRLLSMSSLNKEKHYDDIFEDTLNEAKKLDPDDPEIIEIALADQGNFFRSNDKMNPKELKDYIDYLDQESKRSPEQWIYDYYKARALYENGKGNYEKAVLLIENAFKKNPNDTRLKQTLLNLKSNDEEKRKHSFSIGIGFRLDDL